MPPDLEVGKDRAGLWELLPGRPWTPATLPSGWTTQSLRPRAQVAFSHSKQLGPPQDPFSKEPSMVEGYGSVEGEALEETSAASRDHMQDKPHIYLRPPQPMQGTGLRCTSLGSLGAPQMPLGQPTGRGFRRGTYISSAALGRSLAIQPVHNPRR